MAGAGRRTSLPVALAKFSAPASRHWLRRERLFNLLDEARNCQVIWFSGCAGSGKTVLAASYLAERAHPALWYRLDSRDADPGTFFHSLRLAASQFGLPNSKSLPALTGEYAGGEARFTRGFLERFFADSPPGFVLVLDDFQELPESSDLHVLLPVAFACTPPEASIFVLSRTHPSPGLTRLRANQQLEVVDEASLRLTVEETESLLEHWPDAVRGRSAAAALHGRVQGWAAGIVLIARTGARNTAVDVDTDGEAAIFDYLATELLDRLDATTREFLYTTALVPQFDTALAGVLSGIEKSESILEQLQYRNLFVYREASGVYRYHPLLRALLLRRLHTTWSADDLRALRERAAACLLEKHETDMALPLLRDAGAWPRFVEVLLAHAQSMMLEGRHRELDSWMASLPAAVRDSSSWLQFWHATAVLPVDYATSYQLYSEAFESFMREDDVQGSLLAWIGAVDAIIYSLSRIARLDTWLARFEALRASCRPEDGGPLAGQLASRMTSILMLRQPDHPELPYWRNRAESALDGITDPNQRVLSAFYLVTYSIWRGDLEDAAVLIERAVGRDTETLPPLVETTRCLALAWLGWTSGQRATCVRATDAGLARAEESGVHVWSIILMMQGVTNALIHDATDVAIAWFARLGPLPVGARDMDRAYYYIDRAWLALNQGDTLRALEYQRLALRAAEEFGAVYTRAEACYGMAQVHHALGDAEAAGRYLAQAQQLGRQYGSRTLALQCVLAQAHFALDADDEARAVQLLRVALEADARRDVVAFNGWQPLVLRRLCALALTYGIAVDRVHALIRRFGWSPPDDCQADTWPWPVRIRTFGGFALEVGGTPVDLTRNKHRRPCDLLKLLVASEPHGIDESGLAERLWPDLEGDAAMRNLRTNLHRLRRLLADDAAIQVQQGRVVLNGKTCWNDVRALGQRLQCLSVATAAAVPGLIAEVLRLYAGPFLPGEEGALVTECRFAQARRLRRALVRHGTNQAPDVPAGLRSRIQQLIENT